MIEILFGVWFRLGFLGIGFWGRDWNVGGVWGSCFRSNFCKGARGVGLGGGSRLITKTVRLRLGGAG